MSWCKEFATNFVNVEQNCVGSPSVPSMHFPVSWIFTWTSNLRTSFTDQLYGPVSTPDTESNNSLSQSKSKCLLAKKYLHTCMHAWRFQYFQLCMRCAQSGSTAVIKWYGMEHPILQQEWVNHHWAAAHSKKAGYRIWTCSLWICKPLLYLIEPHQLV